MEVAALCLHIFMNMFVFLLTQPGLSYTDQKPAFPVVSPDRLQFFEYESVSVSCEGDEEGKAWRVRRKLHKMSSANYSDGCSVPAASCRIQFAFEGHSGEYWCENHEGEKSRALKVSVTAGPVILNISARPAKEGSDVTLRCFNKNTKKTHISDFYKDGVHLTTYYKTGMTLGNVSKSDEGFYKCTISRAGESPESWLAVASPEEEEEEGSNEETPIMTTLQLIIIVLLSTVFTLLFWLVGLILYKKRKELNNEIVSDPKDTTYAFVNKPGKRKGGDAANKPDDVTYAAIEIKKKGSKVSSAATKRSSSEQESVYASVALKT